MIKVYIEEGRGRKGGREGERKGKRERQKRNEKEEEERIRTITLEHERKLDLPLVEMAK